MKYIILLLICFTGRWAVAQQLPDYGINRVRINQPDKEIVAGIETTPSGRSARPGLCYYWYSANSIHSTQGGFSGQLLNGNYTEYYADKSLKEQGGFKNGLKDGIWKSWNREGNLLAEIRWKRGAEVPLHQPPLWKRVHLFRTKGKQDTLSPGTTAPVDKVSKTSPKHA